MATETTQKQSIFPDVPREAPETDKDGNFTALWSLSFGALFQALQDNFKNEGIVFPGLSADNISKIQNLYANYIGGSYRSLTLALPDISGQTVYNKTTKFTNQFVIATDTATPPNVTLAEWVPLAMILTSLSNPNYNPSPLKPAVAGVLNWLCYDITDKQLYICTTAGSTGVVPVISPLPPAVWTLI
jgi:hypothetical protein